MKYKSILIIGGTGTVGSFLAKHYLQEDTNIVTLFSRNEQKQVLLSKEPWVNASTNFVIGDLNDFDSLVRTISKYKPNIIINTAALKHIDVCDKNPVESIKINILGNINLIKAVREAKVKPEALVFISTDKVCNPTSVYGMCKGISERLYLDFAKEQTDTLSFVTRFGNILNSSGSIIPIFKKLILNGVTELPITNPNMTRFMITLPEIAKVIDWSIDNSIHGKVVVTSLPAFRLQDLVEILCETYGKGRNIRFNVVGERPGEKIDEDLIPRDVWSTNVEALYYLHGVPDGEIPSYKHFNTGTQVLSKEKLRIYLKEAGALEGE